MVLDKLENYEEMIPILDRILELQSNDNIIKTLATKSKALERLRRFEELLEVLDLMDKLEPNNVKSLNIRAYALKNLGRTEEALEVLNRAELLEPNNVIIIQAKASLLLRMGYLSEASILIEKGLNLHSTDMRLLESKATLLFRMKEDAQALKLINELLSSNEENSVFMVYKLQILIRNGHADQALAIVEPIIKANPDQESLRGLKVKALLELGRIDDAITAINEINNQFFKNYFLASAKIQNGDFNIAIDLLLEIDNGSPNIAWKLAHAYFNTGQLKQAHQQLVQMVQKLKKPSVHVLAALIKIEQMGDEVIRSPVVDAIINALDPATMSKIIQAKEDLTIDWNYAPTDLFDEVSIRNPVYEGTTASPVNSQTFRSTI